MHGIEAILARAGLGLFGNQPGSFARGPGRDLLEHIGRRVETLNQRAQLILYAVHTRELRLGTAKLLTHLGKLLLDGSEILELWRLPERLAELACDLVEPCIQRLDRSGRHDRAE